MGVKRDKLMLLMYAFVDSRVIFKYRLVKNETN